MFTRTFHPDRLIRTLAGTEPFADYCRARGITLEPTLSAVGPADAARRWKAALAQLPATTQAKLPGQARCPIAARRLTAYRPGEAAKDRREARDGARERSGVKGWIVLPIVPETVPAAN